MSSTDIKFSVLTIDDSAGRGQTPSENTLADLPVDEYAPGYVRGHRSLLANAALNDIVVGCAGGWILEHPNKQPLLCVVTVCAEYRDLDPELNVKLLDVLTQAAREAGCMGVWFTHKAKCHYMHDQMPR
jgi:hypothetical protein